MVQPPWKMVGLFLTKRRLSVLCSDCAPQYFNPNKLKAYVHAKTCKWMFIEALFVIAKNW